MSPIPLQQYMSQFGSNTLQRRSRCKEILMIQTSVYLMSMMMKILGQMDSHHRASPGGGQTSWRSWYSQNLVELCSSTWRRSTTNPRRKSWQRIQENYYPSWRQGMLLWLWLRWTPSTCCLQPHTLLSNFLWFTWCLKSNHGFVTFNSRG